MKILKIVVSVLCVASLVFTTVAIAQNRMHWKGSGGWGTGSLYGRMYDPKTVETISGEVAGIESFRPVKGMGAGDGDSPA